MNKLKNLITAVGGTSQETVILDKIEPKLEEKEEIPIPKSPEKKVAEPPLTPGNIKEVPEDVLRKILE